MIVDTTLSSSDNRINNNAYRALKNKRLSFPGGTYENKKEQLEFRDLYVREFLEANGLDSDINLRSTVVFWENGEVVGVISGRDTPSDRSQNISALLE